jgi:hypothetical protein
MSDFYWTISKDEYLERLKVLNTPYHLSVWNYLQAYIIRAKTNIPLWQVCYKLYNTTGLLSANIGIGKMNKSLNISTGKIKGVLNDLDKNDYIIKYVSKNEKKNNVNIYIVGFINAGTDDDSNIIRAEKYFVNRINKMLPGDRTKIKSLFTKQLRTTKLINATTKELKEIQHRLFTM